jgi:hypothetical protein
VPQTWPRYIMLPSSSHLPFSKQRPYRSTSNNLRSSPSTRRMNQKPKTLSCSWMNISSSSIWCTKNVIKFNSKAYHLRFLSPFHKCKNIGEIFVYIKVYHNNFILIIFASSPHQICFTNLGSKNVYTPPYETKVVHPAASRRVSTSYTIMSCDISSSLANMTKPFSNLVVFSIFQLSSY